MTDEVVDVGSYDQAFSSTRDTVVDSDNVTGLEKEKSGQPQCHKRAGSKQEQRTRISASDMILV